MSHDERGSCSRAVALLFRPMQNRSGGVAVGGGSNPSGSQTADGGQTSGPSLRVQRFFLPCEDLEAAALPDFLSLQPWWSHDVDNISVEGCRVCLLTDRCSSTPTINNLWLQPHQRKPRHTSDVEQAERLVL